MTPIIDSSFERTYRSLQKTLPQTLLLHGKPGVGLACIAKSLLPKQYTVVAVTPEQKTKSTTRMISVAMIRALYEEVKTYAKQVVIIDDADTMSEAAQNALLKLIEEPNSSTYFILTSHEPERLLTTIRSRSQSIHVPLVAQELLKQHIDNVKMPTIKKQQLLFISSGRPAELNRLLDDDMYFRERSSQVTLAKSLLGYSNYEIVSTLSKKALNRNEMLRVIDDMIRLLTISPQPSHIQRLAALVRAYEDIRYSGNAKLQLIRAMV